MKLYTVAILGATGAVGQEMIKILEERDFPVGMLNAECVTSFCILHSAFCIT